MHFQGLLCTKKKEAKQMPKVNTKNKVIYLSTIKTQMNLVLFCFGAFFFNVAKVYKHYGNTGSGVFKRGVQN